MVSLVLERAVDAVCTIFFVAFLTLLEAVNLTVILLCTLFYDRRGGKI